MRSSKQEDLSVAKFVISVVFCFRFFDFSPYKMSTRKEIAALDGADSLQSLDPRLSTAYTTFSVSTHIWEFAAAYFWVFRLSQNELIRTKIDLIFYGLVGLALPPFAVIVCAWPIDSIFRNYSRFVALQYALAVNATAATVTYFLLAFYSPTRVFFANGHVHYAYGTSTYVLPFMYGIIAKTTYGIIFALRGDWFGVISEGDTMWLVNITSVSYRFMRS
jgi:hypothetical protein